MPVPRDERSEEYPRYSKRVIESYRRTGLDRTIEMIDQVYALDPDFAELFTQYVRGDLYSREVLSQATREIVACGALACLDKQRQLGSHLRSGAMHGAPKEHLLEAIFQSVIYGGFPSALNSIRTYAEVFPEMVKHDRPAEPATPGGRLDGQDFRPAFETAARMYGEAYANEALGRFKRWDADFAGAVQRFVFGGVYARTVVDPKLRQLIAIGCLTVRNAVQQLETHSRVALRAGATRAEVREVIFQMTAYCGFPYVVQAARAFERVADDWEKQQG